MRDSRMEATSEAAVALQVEVSSRGGCNVVKSYVPGLAVA